MSFLEMLDVLNEGLINKGDLPVSLTTIVAKEFAVLARCTRWGPRSRQTRTYLSVAHENVQDGDTIFIEPLEQSVPVIKDLVVDRSAFDRIQQAGGFVSINTSGNWLMQMRFQPKHDADRAFDAATCIGCGACVVM
jgi:succinate dehydrogenase / fumarate reductase iron-sulfur subunit